MDIIPRYSYDLIDELNELVVTPALPKTLQHWHQFDEAATRVAAFAAGQRALVDYLIASREEIEREKGDAKVDQGNFTDDGDDGGLESVLDPSGEQHQNVASTFVAARIADAGVADGSDRNDHEDK